MISEFGVLLEPNDSNHNFRFPLDGLCLEKDLVVFIPDLNLEGLAREDWVCESHLDRPHF
jgi:hypothetical protein